MSNKKGHFITIGECVDKTPTWRRLSDTFAKLQELTDVIWRRVPQIENLCYCGALSKHDQTLVIYVSSSAANYRVSNLMPLIQEALLDYDKYFSRIILRNKIPTRQTIKSNKKMINEMKFRQLTKLVAAINRPDLLKSQHDCPELSAIEDNDLVKL